MAKIPGTFNGGIPPNIEWDPNNPPIKHTCSNALNHAPGCDGTCGPLGALTEVETALVNESREWARLNMNTTNVQYDSLRENSKVKALINLLEAKGICTPQEMDLFFQGALLTEMQNVRFASQDKVKRTLLGLPKASLLGPDGRPL